MRTIQTPDGVLHQFPDGMSQAVIDHAMRAYSAAHAPAKGMADDVVRSALTGGVEGTAGTLGAIGDIANAPTAIRDAVVAFSKRHGVDLSGMPEAFQPGLHIGGTDVPHLAANIASKLTGLDPRAARLITALVTPGGLASAPTSSELLGSMTGDQPQYQPQTTAGKFARSVAQMAPAALMPGGPVRRIANVVVPGVAAEAAGEAAHKYAPSFEPAARIAAALAAGAGVNMATRGGAPNRLLAEATRGATDEQIAQARGLMERAQGEGIRLTMPEALQQVTTGGTGAGRMQRVIEGTRQGNDLIAPMMTERTPQVRQAVQGFADTVAPPTDQPSMIGVNAQDAATAALNRARQTVNAVAGPDYAALQSQSMEPEAFQALHGDPSYARALAQLRGDPELGATVSHLPDNNLAVVNEVMKRLQVGADQAAGTPLVPGDNHLASLRTNARQLADELARQSSTEFGNARDTVAALSQQHIDPLRAGPIGAISATDSVPAQTAALYPNSPLAGAHAETAQALHVLGLQDPAIGPALTRQHLVRALNEATQNNMVPNQWGGAKLAATIAGNPEQEQTLLAGVGASGGDAGRLSNILEALRATGFREAQGSKTAFNANDLSGLQDSNVGHTLTRLGDPLMWGAGIGDMLKSAAYRRNVNTLAQAIMASPEDAQSTLMAARSAFPQGSAALDDLQRLGLVAQQARQPQLEAQQ